jgi:hypothetical protein
MKVTVERAQLLKSLGHVHRVVERRNTIPILGNVLIRADKSRLSLKATDLDLEVIESLPAEVATAGSTTVPAHMFYDIVRKLPDGSQIVLEATGDRGVLAIRAGRSRFTLQTLPEADYPDLAAGDMTHSFALGAIDMKRLIDKTQFAISTEETRYYLNGIYLHAAGSAKAATLRAVATDGHRLAQVDLPLPQGAAGCLARGEPVGLGAGLEDVGVEGDPVHDRGDQAGVGEDGAPFAERQVGPDRDRGSFLPFGDDLEQQFGAAGVELDVAQLAGQEEVEAAVAGHDAG